MDMGEVAFAVLQANMPAGVEPRWTPTRPSTRALLVPARHPPLRGRGRHRDGRGQIRNYTCVDDVGKVVNPMIVDGQVHGGLVQGIAQALFEEAVYDESARS